MERIVDVHPFVYTDIEEIFDWYSNINFEFGYQFLEEWKSAVNRISANPFAFASKSIGYRELYLKKFPYVNSFQIDDDENIIIYSIKHDKRLEHERYKRM